MDVAITFSIIAFVFAATSLALTGWTWVRENKSSGRHALRAEEEPEHSRPVIEPPDTKM